MCGWKLCRQYENAHQGYKKIKTLLPLLRGPEEILEAISRFVDGELDTVLPNIEAVTNLNDILLHSSDIALNTVTCTRDEYKGELLE
jgi:hypothetical protein